MCRWIYHTNLPSPVAQVKEASVAFARLYASDAAPESSEAPAQASESTETDPTVAHAGLTEIDTTGATATLINGHTESGATSGVPANSDVADDAANAAAESQWDTGNDISASQEEWVKVPRDPTETETGLTATPASATNIQSWADDQPEVSTDVSTRSL